MPSTLLPQESADTLPARLLTSRKWLVQAAHLLGPLGLGRWVRPVSERPQASQLLLPVLPVSYFTAGGHVAPAEPNQRGATTALAFSNPEP